MGFVQVDFGHISKFNSAVSSKLVNLYEAQVDARIQEESEHPKSQTFAPSSIRCPRISWFRLRGVQPDKIKKPDRILKFSADIGTACHEIIQQNLIDALGDDWIDVGDYLQSLNPSYRYTIEKNGFETRVSIEDPPVKFAVDGIIRLNDMPYLLEIKSSEYTSWKNLANPKPHHRDQVVCYATLLHLERCMMIYIDRQYGDIKCFEVTISQAERDNTWEMFSHVQAMVEANVAPEKLPSGDRWCTPSMCAYYNKCKQW